MKRLIRCNTEYEAGGKTFDGYMGAVGWEGKNANLNLDIKEIAKIVRSQFKKKFPGYKCSARISRFSGGESIDVMVWIHKSDLMPKDQFIEDAIMNPNQFIHGYGIIGYYDENHNWISHKVQEIFDMDKEERYNLFSNYYDYVIAKYGSGDKYEYLNENYEPIPVINREPIDYVKNLVDSFNYDDSNAMVDYFNTNFYSHIEYAYD